MAAKSTIYIYHSKRCQIPKDYNLNVLIISIIFVVLKFNL